MRRDADPQVRLRTAKTLAVTLSVPGYREFVFGAEAIHVRGLDSRLISRGRRVLHTASSPICPRGGCAVFGYRMLCTAVLRTRRPRGMR
ncbi:hypothetical protein ABZ942_36935 [Nocardia sp. NPDC046473]|uniref:hypothetical protein n=1 Tax=Nocardia sp. NPDC046473 TaxID=3155733 RepID=UPI003401FCB1